MRSWSWSCAPAAHPDRVAGNPGGEHLPERSRVVRLKYNTRLSPGLADSWRCALWCVDSARVVATLIRSCRNMERRRRSLQRRALPVPPPASRSTSIVNRLDKQKATQKATQLVVVVVVQTRCMTIVLIHGSQRMHRIEVTEHLRVRLPASPPPRALDDEELFIIEG